MKYVSLFMLAALAACSAEVRVESKPVEPTPIVIEIDVPVAKFKVGDIVVPEGIPFDAKIVAILGMQEWKNNETGETAKFMTYMIELIVGQGGIGEAIPAPEQFLTAK